MILSHAFKYSAALQQGQPDLGDESESHEAVENLLESYFMQIDSAYDRLDAIGEYIEDTEEYINIELDSSRNRLLRLEIVLTAGTFGIAMFGLVAGVHLRACKNGDTVCACSSVLIFSNRAAIHLNLPSC